MGGSIFEVGGGRRPDRPVMNAGAGIPAAQPQHGWIAVLTAMKPGLVADFLEEGVGDEAQQVWPVPLAVGGATWCARPAGETRPGI